MAFKAVGIMQGLGVIIFIFSTANFIRIGSDGSLIYSRLKMAKYKFVKKNL